MALAETLAGTASNTSSTASIAIGGIAITASGMMLAAVSIFHPFDAPVVTALSFGGTTATQAVAVKGTAGGGAWCSTSLWWYYSSGGSTATVSATFSGSAGTSSITVVTYTGQDTSSPIGGTATSSGAGGAIAVNVATTNGSRVVDCRAAENYGTDESPGAGQTSLLDFGPCGVSSKAATAATTSMSWTNITNAGFAYCAAEIKEAGAAPGGNAPFFAYTRNPLTAGAI